MPRRLQAHTLAAFGAHDGPARPMMASALEQFVNSVRSLSAQGNFVQLHDFISKSTELLARNVSHLDNVLATLDLGEHSLGILPILVVKFSQNPIPDIEPLYAQFQEFITSCNGEQVRFAPDAYAELCHQFTRALVERREPMRGIDLLSAAIQKIRLSSSQLTSIHSDLCLLCLLAKCPKPALPFLNTEITEISKEGGQFDAKYLLLYYYYGGMIYASLKQYEKAISFLEVAITTPAMAVSHIMLEAYKKHLLLSLIVHGKTQRLPKYASQVVTRFIVPLCQPYQELANAFCSNNSNIQAVVTKHQEVFTRDRNMGLVKQCLSSLYKKKIQGLTKTFMTLSLSDMASRVQLAGPQEAEKYVLGMIEDGEIHATISKKDGMVVFHDNPEKYNHPTMLKALQEKLFDCMEVEKKLKSMEEEISMNPQFLQQMTGTAGDEDVASSSSRFPTFAM